MVDPNLFAPATEPVEVDAETLAAIDRGIEDAKAGRTTTLEEVRDLIPNFLARLATSDPNYAVTNE